MVVATEQSGAGVRQGSGAGLVWALFCVWVVLVAGGFLQDILVAGQGIERGRLFDMDDERGAFTWFSHLLLAGAGGLMLATGFRLRPADRFVGTWWIFLGAVFVCLSADEFLSIHEAISVRLRALLGTDGFLRFAWVLPAMVICAAGLIAAMPFLRRLPAPVRRLMLVSAAVYVGSALGIEMIEGRIVYVHPDGFDAFPYRMAVCLEEALEGLGVMLLIVSHIHYRELIGFSPVPR